jgi:hypothetical protein
MSSKRIVPTKRASVARVKVPVTKKATPANVSKKRVIALTEARDALSELVQKAKGKRPTLLGKTERIAKSVIAPPGEFGPLAPNAIHDISIDDLRKRFKSVREEVENSGAAYRILVNGVVTATLSPTQAAWDSKISRSRANLLSSIVEEMDKKLDDLAKTAAEAEARANAMDMRVMRLLALSEEWFKWWRKEQGLPPTPAGPHAGRP